MVLVHLLILKLVDIFGDKHNTNDFPCLCQDFDSINGRYTCVTNICLLFLWFGEHLDLLVDDYYILAIEVSKYQLGISGKQAIYNKSDEISRKPIYS